MTYTCSNCSASMIQETAHGVEIGVCPNCGGVWLDGEELRTLMTSDPNVIQEIESSIHTQVDQKPLGPSKLLCPIHKTLLDEYHYLYNSPVIVHSCPECGGMFIHGEDLPLMQQWYENSLKPPTKEEEFKIEMAKDIADHEAYMLRQQHLLGMFNTFRGFRPGWYGLWL